MAHSAAEARALLFQRKLQEKPVIFSIPGVPYLDGELSMLELTASELKQAEKLADTPDGTDDVLMMAATVAKSLVMADTKERVFSDGDIGSIDYASGVGSGIAGFGLAALIPLSKLASEASNLGVDLLEDAKKKLAAAQSQGSSSSSTANSAPPVADSASTSSSQG